MHKFQNLHRLTPWKQEFMVSVLDLLLNHSYLAGQMKAALREGGGEMPPEVKELLRTVKQAGKGHPDHHPAVAPIP
jgi:anaerobic magnesium-protoporphyrin IX monomethyl ester cyclase